MFDWSTYLNLAKQLAGTTDEASQRSAVSRSYYSVFCSARNFLRDQENVQIPSGGRAHKYVWDYFERSPDIQRREIGQVGHRLRRARGTADYEDVVPQLGQVVGLALLRADRLFQLLGGL